jgi:hypothetical protein
MRCRRYIARETAGFTVFRQRNPCSERFLWSSTEAASHWAPHTVFILLPDLRTVLITNRWYAREHHYFFRNVDPLRYGSPMIIVVRDVDPDSVFLHGDTTLRQFLADPTAVL